MSCTCLGGDWRRIRQWVFPNRQRSRFNPGAPVLDDATIRHLLDCPEAIENIRRLLTRLYSFYSFKIGSFEDGTYQLNLPSDGRMPWWITPGNHNYLRFTRILQTLGILKLEEDLLVLADILDVVARKYHHVVGERTRYFWCDAVESG